MIDPIFNNSFLVVPKKLVVNENNIIKIIEILIIQETILVLSEKV